MLHEATACHISGELLEVLNILFDLMRCLRLYRDPKDARGILMTCKDWLEVLKKLASLLNTYNPHEMRMYSIGELKKIITKIRFLYFNQIRFLFHNIDFFLWF